MTLCGKVDERGTLYPSFSEFAKALESSEDKTAFVIDLFSNPE
jgi:hypothetical protein